MPKSFWDSFVRTASDAMNSQARARIQQAKADTAIAEWLTDHLFHGETQTWRDKHGNIVANPALMVTGAPVGLPGRAGVMLETDSSRPSRHPQTGHFVDQWTHAATGQRQKVDFSRAQRQLAVDHTMRIFDADGPADRGKVEAIVDAIYDNYSLPHLPHMTDPNRRSHLDRVYARALLKRPVVPRARRRVVDDSDDDEPFDQRPAKRPPERRLDPPVAEEEDAPLLARVKGILDARRPFEPSRGDPSANAPAPSAAPVNDDPLIRRRRVERVFDGSSSVLPDDGAVQEVSSSATRVKVEVPRVPPRPSRASAVAPDAPPIPPRSGRGSVDQGVLQPPPPLESENREAGEVFMRPDAWSDLHEPRDVKEDEDPVDDQDEVFDDDPDHLVFQGEVDGLMQEMQDYEERREREENDFVRPPRPPTPVLPRMDPDIGHDPFGGPDPLPRARPNVDPLPRHPKDEEPAEIEVNDAPGAPSMDPFDFDIEPPTSVMGPIGGVDLFSDYQLLGEDKYETRERRRANAFCLVSPYPSSRIYARLSQTNYSGEATAYYTPSQMGADDLKAQSVTKIWRPDPFVPHYAATAGHPLWSDVTYQYQRDDELIYRSYDMYNNAVSMSHRATCFLTYVPPGLGVSQRVGNVIAAHYLQCRFFLSPVRVRLEYKHPGTDPPLLARLPWDPVGDNNIQKVVFSPTYDLVSSTQSLMTVHRLIFVYTSDLETDISDLVVDPNDIFSPISLHTRGKYEIVKDCYFHSDKDIVDSVNIQFKDRPFYFTPRRPNYRGDSRGNGAFVRGKHLLLVYVAAVLNLPLYPTETIVFTDYYDDLLRPPSCTVSYCFSYADK